MALFLDTSALVKLFVREPGSEKVERLTGRDPQIHVGPFAHHEFVSAVKRRTREGSLTPAGAAKALAEFREDLNESFLVVQFSQELSRRALLLLEGRGGEGLRTLDAFQLSACLGVPGAVFLLADRTLAKIAHREGVKTILC
ncbi:MAG: type II toxin-antitoxin system VapC family toxin [Candidatus Coatesbacteria bacterium]